MRNLNVLSLVRPLCGLLLLSLACTAKIAPAYALDPDKQISQYAHTGWRVSDGFLGGFPLALAQTKDGYLWIGTSAGLQRYDGERFVRWAIPGGDLLRSVQIYHLLGASDGSLWIGTYGQGVLHTQGKTLARYPGGLTTSLFEDRSGAIWASRYLMQQNSDEICEIKHDEALCHGTAEGLPEAASAFATDKHDGAIWIAGRQEIIKWRHGSIEKKTPLIGPVKQAHAVNDLLCAPDGTLWVGFTTAGPGRGLQHLINGVLAPFKTAEWDSSNLPVTRLLLDRNDSLWVGTGNQGLFRIQKDGRVDHFSSLDGLTGDNIFDLLEDHEGNIWATSPKGVDVFRSLAVTTFTAREGVGIGDTVSVHASKNGSVWVGGDSRLDSVLDGRVTRLPFSKRLQGLQVTSLLEDKDGHLWIGTDDKLSILENNLLHEIKRPSSQSVGFVVGITQDIYADVWVEVAGPPRELLQVRARKVISVFSAARIPSARKLAADPQGGIWLGLLDGDLARFRGSSLDVFRYPHEFESMVNEIAVEEDGTVLGATKTGLLGWRAGVQQTLSTANGLPCNDIDTFIRDRSGSLWLYTQCGLIQIAASEVELWWLHPDRQLTLRTYDAADGVQPAPAPFQGAARSVDGKLWFANGVALQMIAPEHLHRNTSAPPVHMESLAADGNQYSISGLLHLPSLTRNVSIHYSALSFEAPQKVVFRYILEGQDTAWQDAGTRRDAFYTNLSPGNYRFRVIACNNDGVWNESGDSLDFTVLPAYFQTKAFLAFSVLLAVTLLWLMYVLRVKRAQFEIEQRLGARLEERERISRELHDTLLQGFQGLVLRFQSVMKLIPKDAPSHQSLEEVLERADQVLLEGRESVRGLRADSLPATELSDALTGCGKELSAGSQVAFKLETAGVPRPLSPMLFNEVYKIAREALLNAFQHSQASRIEVFVSYGARALTVKVHDNGMGIEPSVLKKGRHGHWGLPGMRERAKKIGSRLRIRTEPGQGTEVAILIHAKNLVLGFRPRTLWQKITFRFRAPEES